MSDTSDFTGFVDRAILHRDTSSKLTIEVIGWLLSPNAEMSELFLSLPDSDSYKAELYERYDVAEKLPEIPHAPRSGFRVFLPVPTEETSYIVNFRAKLSNNVELSSFFTVYPKPKTSLFDEHALSSSVFGALEARNLLDSHLKLRLESFKLAKTELSFQKSNSALISIIIPLHNQGHYLLGCLQALLCEQVLDLEIIIIDNDSNIQTKDLLKQLKGVTVISNQNNLHFGKACNQGARVAKGQYLLFLNSDAFVMPGALKHATQYLIENPQVGAVGATLMRADGRIQEVGSFVLPNGTTVARGRGGTISNEAYSKPFIVDYCSAAFLLTPRELFLSSGLFNEKYSPAYFEDVDYCIRLAKQGYQTVVEPKSLVLHLERGSSESLLDADLLISVNREKFLADHSTYINKPVKFIDTSFTAAKLKTILVIDDAVPSSVCGQGQARAELLISSLCEIGHTVWVYPVAVNDKNKSETEKSFKIVSPSPLESESDFLLRILPQCDLAFVSRPQHMERVQSVIRSNKPNGNWPRIIYDAEALQSKREILRLEVTSGSELSDSEIVEIVSNEVVLARDADLILAVSEPESVAFTDFGFKNLEVLSFGINVVPTKKSFSQRRSFLTVGPLLNESTPNVDALIWFLDSVVPWLEQVMKNDPIALHVVGENRLEHLEKRQGPNFQLWGRITDLENTYDSHRVFVAPTRFSAGISLKVIEAAAYGLPVVASPVVAAQLGWTDGQEILVGYTAQDFAAKCAALYHNEDLWQSIRKAALKRIEEQFSMQQFKSTLTKITQCN